MSVPAPVPNRQGSVEVKSSSSSARMPTSASSSTLISQASGASANALYNFRLLSALRSDNPSEVQPFLDELRPSTHSAEGMEDLDKAGRLLGMAVRVASVPTIQAILQSSAIPNPNLPINAGSTTTPLHVASEIGRAEIVELLLNDSRINDTIRDEQGRTALECATHSEVSHLIEESRGQLQLRYLARLAGYISSPLSSVDESLHMIEFLEGPRTGILNLSALDERSGTSLLHEAARRRDLRLVELAVKRGADVFVRDKRGRRVLDGEKNADERIKVFLRQFNNQDSLVQAKSDGKPPDLRGFLSKWVNYRSGWRTRWFVLENGVLSYYRNREDEQIACRGSIAMAVATLHPSTDGSRFEVHSKISSSVPKFIVKSAHRAEIARWVQSIRLNIEYYQKKGTSEGQPKRSMSMNQDKQPVPSLPPADSFLSPKLQRSTTGLSGLSVPAPFADGSKRDMSSSRTALTEDDATEILSVFENADNNSLVGSGDQHSGIPHETSYDLSVLNIKAQLDMTSQLVDSIVTPPTSTNASPVRGGGQEMIRSSSRQQAVKEALKQSLSTLSNMISQTNIMTADREKYLLNRVQREVEARHLWEENMLTVAQQQAEADRQLTEAAQDNEKKRKALKQAKEVLANLAGSAAGIGELPSLPTSPGLPDQRSAVIDQTLLNKATAALPKTPTKPSLTPRPSIPNIQEAHDAIVAAEGASDDEDEDDDEFFDAIETGTIPNLKLYDSIAHPEKERPGTPTALERGSFSLESLEPYLHVRSKLPIDDDKRPSVSLWSILKSSVGKDLTKISFPVSFNECTSMLQRMAEDMEYDACLTVAASEQDSLKRIAFVGAFAMSNYSSTIGRIAKPFNPLLSQSFEYAIPNRYRYISEQVSHHPPISACYSEAPTWKYYGEVDAQNKFQGRSFEIRPTGVAHCELIIPRSWVDEKAEYPNAGSEYGDGLVVEHYSWKKVTTNVSNFIMGNPLIDHYGDLVVTNHRTGETCTLTFKPRGWRGKDAFEIKGNVVDAHGRTEWDIAGRWDTQLIARQHGTSAPLEVDTTFNPTQKEYLLLWRNSEKPKAPFNLTPFAVTLNDIPGGLQKYLAPTDCRLRTDQRAFENAEYDRAQELKTLNEEKQRMTRKLRAEGKLPPHQARWFESTTDPDSGERLWLPKRSDDGEVKFWHEREKADWEKVGVDHIFAEDER
uniref:Oxysterol-binding protein n=1 Tax=Kwoniella dejecticola CBS 10117 TaxID=1296121 RepID=A0A1A5ZYM4_9TREE|nr:oxysterol-binding protein [Kwoniella dejecticola CBS 10117]OBR82903.1 oxysterol-binding protein [Kwoniella dejecticola CBS 10117]